MNEKFRSFAHNISIASGSPWAFAFATGIILCWLLFGPMFNYSDTWQLIINTGTTIVTFLMVFLIQNTQNRDSRAMQLKLDELIRANKHARNQMIDLETLSDRELDEIHDELVQLNLKTQERINTIHHHRKNRSKKKQKSI